MSKRSIPFGYRIENGEVALNCNEAQIYTRMTELYLNGASLKSIVKAFNEEQIEYTPGVVRWNKSRIMRLLSDERYTGCGEYPAIISIEVHERLLSRRDENSYLLDTNLTDEIYRLEIPVVCPYCSGILKRKISRGKRGRRIQHCDSCGVTIHIDDNDYLTGIKNQLERYVDDPFLISVEETSASGENARITQLNREIESAIERLDANAELIAQKIKELTSLRYRTIGDQYYISKKLRWEFLTSRQLRSDDPNKWKDSLIDLANRTIKETHIDENGKVSAMLINGQLSPEME